MEKIIYVILMDSCLNNYDIGDFKTKEEAEKYIEDNNLNAYPHIPIIIKRMA